MFLALHMSALLAVLKTKKRADDVWKELPWKKFQRQVFRLQRAIFKAQKNGNKTKVKRLQRLLLQSRAAQALAVKQVTQNNKGKKTPGVDGRTALTVKQRLLLCRQLRRNWAKWQHQPLRRVNIPKPNGKTRGLGIPTIADRAWQCLLKFAAEPAYEATAGERSYGFRLGRSTHDAQKLIFNNLNSQCNGKDKLILETDISKCFDEIDHEVILKGVILPQEAAKGLRKAVRVGVKSEFPSSEAGTPQGGVISPLLANIALDGFENLGSDQKVKTVYTYENGKSAGNRVTNWSDGIRGIRYADDAVFICKPGTDIQKLRQDIDKFLASRGLRLNKDKTEVRKATDGFDFLGWHFRVNSKGTFKSYPSHDNYMKIKTKIRETWLAKKTPTEVRLKRIASQVRGWRMYHRYCDRGKQDLWAVNQWVYRKLKTEKRRTSKKEAEKLRTKLLRGHAKPKGAAKRQATKLEIEKAFPKVPWEVNAHVMVKGAASPFDGNTAYWVRRNSKLYTGPTADAIKRQKGKCAHCNLPFLEQMGPVELHHKDGNHNNWDNKNLVALHRPCHQMQAGRQRRLLRNHRKHIKDGIRKCAVKA